MARAVVLLFLIVAITAISAYPGTTQCGPNEVFNNCGTSCQPTCDNPNPTVCTLACKIGCECAEGFLRNSQGQCVLTQSC